MSTLRRLALICLFAINPTERQKTHASGADLLNARLDAHLVEHPEGDVAFSFHREDYQGDFSDLPIGVFDSGIGGLTVLEAILTLDHFHNDSLQPGSDGRPDFENERFVYLGDQANMPYGNYPKAGKTAFLRELILKDAVFLLGRRYRNGADVSLDKPAVKAIVVACNTATAYGLEDIRDFLKHQFLPVPVVGVVEAGARGLLETEASDASGAIGVLATVGTCDSGVYPRTIQRTLGRAGRRVATITQHGSADLAALIEGDPSHQASLSGQIRTDVRRLVESHRSALAGKDSRPLDRIVLGCTHFPLVLTEIDATFTALRKDPELAPFIAESRRYIDPAEWTARQLFIDLAKARLRHRPGSPADDGRDLFFISVADPACPGIVLNPDGTLRDDYKFGRETGLLVEDTPVTPLTRARLPESGRRLVSEKLPAVWQRIP